MPAGRLALMYRTAVIAGVLGSYAFGRFARYAPENPTHVPLNVWCCALILLRIVVSALSADESDSYTEFQNEDMEVDEFRDDDAIVYIYSNRIVQRFLRQIVSTTIHSRPLTSYWVRAKTKNTTIRTESRELLFVYIVYTVIDSCVYTCNG